MQIVDIAVSPHFNAIEDGGERVTDWRQLVFDARRDFGEGGACQQAFIFKRFQLCGKCRLCCADFLLNFAKAPCTGGKGKSKS